MWIIIIGLVLIVLSFIIVLTYLTNKLYKYCFIKYDSIKMIKKIEYHRSLKSDAYLFREELLSKDSEKLEIKSDNNNELIGYLFKQGKNNKKLMILVHGWHTDAFMNVSRFGKMYFEDNSYDILIVYNEAHYPSGGDVIGFGVTDSNNLVKWVNYINELYPNKYDIYLHGVSMGASSCLFSFKHQLPSNIKGIIVDSGFNNVYEELKYSAKARYGRSFNLILKMIRVRIKRKLKYDIVKENVLDVINNYQIPILFIHGDKDLVVPMKMTIDTFNAYKGLKKLYIAKDAGHIYSYSVDPSKYKEEVYKFIEGIKV